MNTADPFPATHTEPSAALRIALAGNPNSGKTSIFNLLTGSRQHVANFPGVTVERKEGRLNHLGREWSVVDLPGTYSLTAYSIEEIVARNFLVEERPDLVVDVLDTSNLRRNLYLATQLQELELPLVFAANMLDVARRRGVKVDLAELSRQMGIPVVGMEGHRGRGLAELRRVVVGTLDETGEADGSPRHRLEFGEDVESGLAELEDRITRGWSAAVRAGKLANPPARWVALRLLERDNRIMERLEAWQVDPARIRALADELSARIERLSGTSAELFLANRRYEHINRLLEECRATGPPLGRQFRSDVTDRLLLNRFLGLPIFLLLMYLSFQLTFSLGELPMDLIEGGFNRLAAFLGQHWPLGGLSWLKSLLIDGVIAGVGGVLVFLPNIVLLFLCLSLMEDTGYMSRAAFLMDRLMHRIGLHGKSFIPLLTGFGCSIPGIMGTRVLENERDRLLTMLVLPLMSCGARLPIYLLIIPAFFPEHLHARMLFSIYLIGVLLAVGLAKLLRISVLKGENTPFVMELPPYKLPTLRSVWLQISIRAGLYLKKAGTLILGISILLWALASWPRPSSYSEDTMAGEAGLQREIAAQAQAGQERGSAPLEAWEDELTRIANLKAEEELEHSLLGRLGHFIEPAMRPMGFDWKIGSSMLGTFAAKEVFVAQLGVVFALGETEQDSEDLRRALRERYRPLIGFCVMLFALVATPCMATFAVVRRESGSARWAWFQLLGLTALAWLLTTVVFQAGSLLGF